MDICMTVNVESVLTGMMLGVAFPEISRRLIRQYRGGK